MVTKSKVIIPVVLGVSLMLSGCNFTTKKDAAATPTPGSTETAAVNNTPVDIELLGMSSNETDLNIVRDQLAKNGFNVKLNVQPDYGTFKAQQDAGNFDVALSSWTTVTGNPDYAVRSLFKTGGDYSIMSDPEIDKLIDQASAQTPEQYTETYKKFEQQLVLDKAYIAPLYNSLKAQAFNQDVLKKESVRLSKSRSLPWEELDFKDAAKRAKDPIILQSALPSLTSLDPIKANDGSINIINTNMYVRLLNLTDDDKLTADGSLSYNFAIAEGNSDYYFVLRDDIHFAQIKDKLAADSGERVGAEDVIFSLNRAKDKNSVPNHRTFTLHEHIQKVELVTDPAVLESVKLSGGSGTLKSGLEKGLDSKISTLVSDKNQASNKEGKYQVVKLTTTQPFPQVLNYLAHQSAGIVSKKQVQSINTYDVAKYDVNKDISYGDQSTVTEGAKYNNALYTSGPYILSYKNDYEAVFYKNPGYMKGTKYEPKVDSIKVRFIKDAESSLSALRSGEIHLFYGVSEIKFDVIKADTKLALQTVPSNAVSYLLFNTKNREVAKSADLRRAVLYSVNQDEFLAYYKNNKFKAVSTLSPIVKTGLEVKADAAKAKDFLNKYKASK
ncbi:ABC transporter substrate-binding protein [Paenibacillus sp. HWE-109]|uniref:ABC transporter substrate-binding protein n=1 Tax=Paenibacillus sp. HWE-109 TaxID=1306526 RepID=UPI001EDFD884|nr:ABC transporter substrate-binding protein [Paenibacillus sp. HWE-109]UKS27028.1 ABC transporter substrate-binding protein [Paenibacillus sp. HWE-109]